MHDPHNLMLYARSVFPKSLEINNYHQKRSCLIDALFETMSAFLYEDNTDIEIISKQVFFSLTKRGLFEKDLVKSWIENHFLPDAQTLIRREYQKQQRSGKIWPVEEYVKHRESGASMHNEAMSYLLLIEPKIGIYSSVWSSLSNYLVIYTDLNSWRKDKKQSDYYNLFFSLQYELEISEKETLLLMTELSDARKKLLDKEIARQPENIQVFAKAFLNGASLWCESTPRYHQF